MSTSVRPMKDRRGRVYTPAVGPRQRPWLWVVLVLFALLGANGFYLSSVTAVTWWLGITQQTYFYFLMVIFHLVLGFAVMLPYMGFGVAHLVVSWKRPNREAIYYGLALFAVGLVVIVSGLLLVRLGVFEVRDPSVRRVNYWLHVLMPLLAIALYVKHRLAGPRVRWVWARRFGGVVAAFVLVMAALHSQDPRSFGVKGPKEGKHFFPSSAITSSGKFIPAETLMMDDYCLKCHQDTYGGWFHSSHHFSSFNNKAYLFSVRETRQATLKRDGNTRGARWCAGCHDPVPFFSGKFDDPDYDDVNDPTSQAGITCTSCHSITNINSTRGNADYTIEEPQHYPFATSTNPVLQWVNNQLVKAKPEMHKKTFLKPVIKDSKFCSACHKVSIPCDLEPLQGLPPRAGPLRHLPPLRRLGHGGRSFYYPAVAKGQCVECHMNAVPSSEFGAKDFDGNPGREVHNHMFPAANTGLATLLGSQKAVEAHARYLEDKKVRVDLFGLRDGGEVDSPLTAPLRPETPALRPGKPYLVEVVVRTLGLGHPFSQGTVDSNEIWVELIARVGDRVVGRSGGIGPDGTVDPFAHFINVYMLDRDGNRIDRRNPQDIFVALYNKQIPPGAGQTVHFGLDVPSDVKGPVTLEAKVNYRKFDRTLSDYIFGKGQGPTLPVIVMARDTVSLPVVGGPPVTNEPSPIKETWQRWNDYGIGLLIEGAEKGGQKGELKQAEEAFKKVAELGQADGWVNLARVTIREGRLPDALDALEKAAAHPKPAAPWVINWLTGQVNDRNGNLDAAIASYEAVLATRIPSRGFDFSVDFEVINALAAALYNRARLEPLGSPRRLEYLRKTIAAYRNTLAIDSENVAAHYGLGLAYHEFTQPSYGWEHWAKAGEDRPATAEELAGFVKAAAQPSVHRYRTAAVLSRLVERFVEAPRPEFGSRLESLFEVVDKVAPAWETAQNALNEAPLARTLEVTHKALHKLLKPDETAEGRAVATARKNNPAADQNAQSVVIHSLHRPGAPGIDAKAATVNVTTPAVAGTGNKKEAGE